MDLADCRKCRSSKLSYGRLMCSAMSLPKPVEFMRHDLSECGPEAMLFEPKGEQKYAEFDDK